MRAFQACDLDHARHGAASARTAHGLDDDVDGADDEAAHGAQVAGKAMQAHQHLQPLQGVGGAVGMNGGHRAVMAGAHGLQNFDRFVRAHFAQNYAVGPHSECVAQKVAGADFARAVYCRGARFHSHHMRHLQSEFRGVFNGDDALLGAGIGTHHIEKRGLAGAGAARNENVAARAHRSGEIAQAFGAEGAIAHQVLAGEGHIAEFADRDMGAVQCHGWDHDIEARSVGQPSIDVRIGFVHPPPDRGDDALNDVHQMVEIAEPGSDKLQFAIAFDIDRTGAVDDHIIHAGIVEQRLERPESGDLVDHIENELRAFRRVQCKAARAEYDGDGARDLVKECGMLDCVAGDALPVEIFERDLEHTEFHLLILVGHQDVVAAVGGRSIGLHQIHPALARLSQCKSLSVEFSVCAGGSRPISASRVRKASL